MPTQRGEAADVWPRLRASSAGVESRGHAGAIDH